MGSVSSSVTATSSAGLTIITAGSPPGPVRSWTFAQLPTLRNP
jgi:hypothetical protein